jgi:group I intron endonuclease
MGRHHNEPLQRAFEKYGESGLSFSILLICSKDQLLDYEQRALDILNPEYNVCRVAGSHLGIKRSAETSARMSEAQRLRAPPTKETRTKLRAAKIGTKATAESCAKRSASLRAHYANPEAREASSVRTSKSNSSPDTRAKISAALTGIKRSEETRARMSKAQMGHVSKQKGIPRSDEVKAKISATKRANFARKKNEILE